MKHILYISILLLVYSCEAEIETPDDAPDIDISNPTLANPELLEFYYFPVGSYWIYKRIDTTFDVFDTVIVERKDFNVRTHPFAENAVGVSRCFYRHTYYRDINTFEPLSVTFTNSIDAPQSLSLDTDNSSPFTSNLYLFTYPFDSVTISQSSSFICSLVNRGEYTFQNVNYSDVFYLRYGDSQRFNEFYLVKNIGIVKFYLNDDSSEWELVKYQIL